MTTPTYIPWLFVVLILILIAVAVIAYILYQALKRAEERLTSIENQFQTIDERFKNVEQAIREISDRIESGVNQITQSFPSDTPAIVRNVLQGLQGRLNIS
jgi:predicted PurR-regulated permease PerM